MFMYLDAIAEKNFPFTLSDVTAVSLHDGAMFASLKGGSEYKIVDIPEALTKGEIVQIALAFKERLEQMQPVETRIIH